MDNSSESPSNTWLHDSRANHHLKPLTNHVPNASPYLRSEGIVVGNGSTLPITNASSSFLNTCDNCCLTIKNVLHNPSATINLSLCEKIMY